MLHAYTAQNVRAAEAPLLENGHGDELMRRAAWGLVTHVLRLLRSHGAIAGRTVAALVGSGNNGGDGLWALSFLRARGVDAVAVPVSDRMHEAGRTALLAAGGRVAEAVPERAAVVIDAVLGTGADRGYEPRPPAGQPSADQGPSGQAPTSGDARRYLGVPEHAAVVACDMPSGVDAATGNIAGAVIPAELTVTFGALKTGLMVGAGAHASGRVELVDIGLGPHLPEPDVASLEAAEALAVFGPPAWDAHKYSRGVLGVAAGSDQYPGAAVLTTGAAVATGLGMVRYAGPDGAQHHVLAAHPEIVATGSPQGRVQAWVVGPGLGSDGGARGRFTEVLDSATEYGVPVVMDASALDLVTLEDLARLRAAGSQTVITPHQGELLRLVDRLGPQLVEDAGEDVDQGSGKDLSAVTGELAATDPVRAARLTAEALGVVVLLKGPTTICAAPDGRVLVQGQGGSELSTAGTGDCLAGIIGGALARAEGADASSDPTGATDGDRMLRFAAAGAWLHGLAGARARVDGPFGASVLPAAVRAVLAERTSWSG